MLKATEAKSLIRQADISAVEIHTIKILNRIEELIRLSCERGLNKTVFQIKYEVNDIKNELTRSAVSVKLLSTLQNFGYEVQVYDTEFTIKW
jgi:hypothetical protein